ncbi:unnamed protein product [Rhizoctonia solani]|uniref:Uncharacterized protein n=1 Tax=Rhizoctonia solani TaxID=456999 RepID=A0A8H3AJV8_9AGAM|nr:unnamed protein product [Rhizoctonia solani]
MNRIFRANSISTLLRLRRSREAGEGASVPRLNEELAWPDSNELRAYYTAAKALAQGYLARPGLPPELVIYICRLADFEVIRARKSPEGIREVRAWSSKIESRLWFQTESFTKQMLSRIKGVQLITMSHHQGWIDNPHAGSWSWFELRIARPVSEDASKFEVKRRPGGDEASWWSHSHPVEQEIAIKEQEFLEHKGFVFGPGDELWDEIEEGDVLQVMLKAQFSGWSNVASDGALKISTWWEPSSEMLKLLYNGSKR